MRMPWLFASCIGGIIASFIIGHFQMSLSKLAYLAAFIPVIMGMGGNIGVQSATITVRGLATGRLSIRDISSVVSKQFMVGLMLGLFYGFVVGLVAQFKYSSGLFALSVGLGVFSSMTMAALAGSCANVRWDDSRAKLEPWRKRRRGMVVMIRDYREPQG